MTNISMAEIKLTDTEIEAAVRVLRSGALRQGKESDGFEREFADKVGATYAVTSANGSAALHLAYMAFLAPGDEVLVPSFTFIATGSMVTMAGGTPILCDVDEKSFLISLEDAETRITKRTKAIAPVHLFGNACDIEAIKKFAEKHNLVIVWDAAQAHGATFNGRDVGGFGDIVCYSFYPSKNMFVGEGGMTCTNNEGYDQKMRFMRSHGQTGKYLHTMWGLNYRMTDVEAAIGREQLQRLEEMVAIRRRNAAILSQGLKDMAGIQLQEITKDSEHAYHQYCIVVSKDDYGCDRDVLASRLKEKGVATGVHYPRGLHEQPVFVERYGPQKLSTTEWLAENILALPVHHGLVEGDLAYVLGCIKDIHASL